MVCSLGGKQKSYRRVIPFERSLHKGKQLLVLCPAGLHSSLVPTVLRGCAQGGKALGAFPQHLIKKIGWQRKVPLNAVNFPTTHHAWASLCLETFRCHFVGFLQFLLLPSPLPCPLVFCFISISGRGGEDKRQIKKGRVRGEKKLRL